MVMSGTSALWREPAFVFLRTASQPHWDACQAAADHLGLGVTETFLDKGIAASAFDRPDFERLLEQLGRGDVNYVLTADPAGLAREAHILQRLSFACAASGTTLIVAPLGKRSINHERNGPEGGTT